MKYTVIAMSLGLSTACAPSGSAGLWFPPDTNDASDANDPIDAQDTGDTGETSDLGEAPEIANEIAEDGTFTSSPETSPTTLETAASALLMSACDEDDGVVTEWWWQYEGCLADRTFHVRPERAEVAANCRATYAPFALAGHLALADETLVQRCFDALATPCESDSFASWTARTEVCEHMLIGQLGPGASCTTSEECAGDSFCDLAGPCGVCRAAQPANAPCVGDDACMKGLACLDGVCAALRQPAGSACSHDVQCAEPLNCFEGPAEGAAGSGVCTAPDLLGAVCTTRCLDDLVCLTGSDGVSRCQQRAARGEACVVDADFDWTRPLCQRSLACIGGQCATRPRVGAGARCGHDQGACTEGLRCAEGVCAAYVPNGDGCLDDSECSGWSACVQNVCSYSQYNEVCYSD